MSGEKFTTISNSELDRLLGADRSLRNVRRDLPNLLDNIRRQSSSDLQRMLDPLEARQQRYQEELQSVSSNIRELELQTAVRFRQQQIMTRQAIQSMAGRLRRETHLLLIQQQLNFEIQLGEEKRARQAQFQELQAQIDELASDRQRRLDLAGSLVEGAQVIRNFITANYRHQDFAPDEMAKLDQLLVNAEDLLNQRVPDAAVLRGQEALDGFSELRLKLEASETEWHFWRAALLEGIIEQEAILSENRECRLVNLDGAETDHVLDVEHWSQGSLSSLEEELVQIKTRLQEGEAFIPIKELQDLVEVKLPELDEQLTTVVRNARINALSSQLRSQIAELAVLALLEQGYQPVDGVYDEEDNTQAYTVKVKDYEGSEVVVRVDNLPGQDVKQELSVHSYDFEQRSEREREKRSEEIAAVLRQEGLGVGDFKSEAVPDESLRDFEALRRKKPLTRRASTSSRSQGLD